jgi:hypothetical protein
MDARQLQGKIHMSFSKEATVWYAFGQLIYDLYYVSPYEADGDDHLIREFNRKIDLLGINTAYSFRPMDSGFRFKGTRENILSHTSYVV